jgi:hypothetical protein
VEDTALVRGVQRARGGGDDAERGGIHVFLYEGASPGSIQFYPGCGVNPAQSFEVSGAPVVGGTLAVAIDNPLGTQGPGSLAVLGISLSGTADGSCGIPLPGFNLDPAKPCGELLIAPPIPVQIPWTASVWMGPGQPVTIPVAVPDDLGLLGTSFFLQGLLFDPVAALTGTQPLGLTRGAQVTIGT